MNHHLHDQLSKRYETLLIDGMDVPFVPHEKAVSKIRRSLGLKGLFAGFSVRRLDRLAAGVAERMTDSASLNFFHGATPWLHVESRIPHACYLDACFATYMDVYQDAGRFHAYQLKGLFEKESVFLARAKAVFFNSRWALEDCVRHYGIPSDNMHVAGLGGVFEQTSDFLPPGGGPYFLFIGHDFMGKGGDKVVRAFEKVSVRFPDIRLIVVGQRPPDRFLRNPRVEYAGTIDKSDPVGLRRIKGYFHDAVCFVLPTSKDSTPLVLLESSSMGCPVVSTRRFGIPEMVLDGVTGFLLDDSEIEERLPRCMERFCSEEGLRGSMGAAAELHVMDRFTWNRVGERIHAVLSRGDVRA